MRPVCGSGGGPSVGAVGALWRAEAMKRGRDMIQPSAAAMNPSSTDSTTTDEVRLSKNAVTVLENRYLNRDDHGKVIESPAQLFRRVARHVASCEPKWGASAQATQEIEDTFFRLMAERYFMPNSPTLMNAGRGPGVLAACFVLPLRDSTP